MKINTETAVPYAQRTPSSIAGNTNAESFAAVLSAAASAASKSDTGGKHADFTSMTQQEMRDWTNDQIRGGKMSLDDSRPFMAMSMNISVDGIGSALVSNAAERIDFRQKIRSGIEGALSRNDEASRRMLESALNSMQQCG